MSQTHRFTICPEPIESELDVLGDMTTVYIGAGIVNPMGPTLTLLIGDGILSEPGETQALYQVMLNPFNQSCYEVGEVEIGEEWRPAKDLAPFFNLGWGSCPTLLIPSAAYSAETAQQVFTEFLQTFEDGAETLEAVKKHPGDPWTRVKGEMDGLADILAKLRGGASEETVEGNLTPAQAAELARLQLDPKNLFEEFKAFLFGWEGSMNFTGMSGLSKDDFADVFSKMAMTARLPFMKNIFDNPEILEG
jgi:hypothetical protein